MIFNPFKKLAYETHFKCVTPENIKYLVDSNFFSEYILLEFADGLSRLHYRHLAINFLKAIEKDKDLVIIRALVKMMQQASQLYQEQTGKYLNLSDC